MRRAALAPLFLAGVVSLLALAASLGDERRSVPQTQREQFEAEIPKTILELQQFRESSSARIRSAAGKEGTATLVNLNPAINAWYLLKVAWKNGSPEGAYHLENASPRSARIFLDEKNPSGLVIAEGARRYSCDLFGSDSPNALEQGKASRLVYYPLCDHRIYLRNPATGHRTTLEAATEFLREHVWGGEKIISFGHILMGDMHRETGALEKDASAAPGAGRANGSDLPLPALIDSKYADRLLTSANLGIDLEGPARTGMTPGAWYAASGDAGIYASILQPNLIVPSILESYKTTVGRLDGVEASALCYLVAFDLDRFALGYALGTEHPKVGWSDRALAQARDAALPGPDGIGGIGPLIATGLLSSADASRTVSTFTGGFKRTHGAFKYGDLALRNHGSHYGFIENGVVFSKLQPGLSTIFVLDDDSVAMKTWTGQDDALLPRIRHARQNGVPLVESGAPGPLVNRWGPGNWSGSEEGKLRTMRSGVALQSAQPGTAGVRDQTKSGRKRFLIYAVFSDATPSAMARVFQAYRCDYGMLLDMNALEHTYLAVYRRSGSQVFVDHLLKGMSVLEKSASQEIVPRFLGYADNRDFFYVMRR
jgi:hypothetical protein